MRWPLRLDRCDTTRRMSDEVAQPVNAAAGDAVRVGSGRALALEALLQPIGERALRYLREAFLELRTMG